MYRSIAIEINESLSILATNTENRMDDVIISIIISNYTFLFYLTFLHCLRSNIVTVKQNLRFINIDYSSINSIRNLRHFRPHISPVTSDFCLNGNIVN